MQWITTQSTRTIQNAFDALWWCTNIADDDGRTSALGVCVCGVRASSMLSDFMHALPQLPQLPHATANTCIFCIYIAFVVHELSAITRHWPSNSCLIIHTVYQLYLIVLAKLICLVLARRLAENLIKMAKSRSYFPFGHLHLNYSEFYGNSWVVWRNNACERWNLLPMDLCWSTPSRS